MNHLLKKIENTYILYFITALVIFAFIIYAPSLFNGFVWDDEEQIVNNPAIQSISFIPHLFTGSTFNSGGAGATGIYYKPLLSISYAVNFALWGNNAFGFHVFSLLLHAANSILIFLLFKKLFEFKKYPFIKTVSFIFSLIFLVHPANSESVAYAASVQELLYVFFLLTTILLLLRWAENITIKKLAIISSTFLFSLLSKDSALAGIPILIAVSYIFYRKVFKQVSISLLCSLGLYLFLRLIIGRIGFLGHPSIAPIAKASFLERIQTIPYELYSYLRIVFFPKDLFISQHTVIKSMNFPFFLMTFFVLFIMASLVLYAYKLKSSVYTFFLFWVAATTSILLNIYPLDMTIAERWLYAPLIGFFGILSVIVFHCLQKNKKIGYILLIILTLCIPLLSIRTIIRNADWKDDEALFSHDIELNKNAYDLQSNYGLVLFRAGNIKEAKKHFEISIALAPQWSISYNNLGVVYQREKNIEKAKELYAKSLQYADYYLAYENLAALKAQTEPKENSIAFLKNALKKLPYNSNLNYYLAYVYYQNNATDSAKPYAQEAYLLSPTQQTYLLYKTIFKEE